MRIFINRRPVEGPWGGGNLFLKSFVTEFQKAGHEVTFDLNKKMDAIFIQDPRYGNTPASINEIEALKNTKKHKRRQTRSRTKQKPLS